MSKLTLDEAHAIVAAALAQAGEDEVTHAIRTMLEASRFPDSDKIRNLAACARKPEHHVALVALLRVDAHPAGISQYAAHCTTPIPLEQLEQMVRCLEGRHVVYGPPVAAGAYVCWFVKNPIVHCCLTTEQHRRLMMRIFCQGRCSDMVAYTRAITQVMDRSLHDVAIPLLRQDTYHGTEYVEEYSRAHAATLAQDQIDALIEVIGSSVQHTGIVYDLLGFMRFSGCALTVGRVDRILELMQEQQPLPGYFVDTLKMPGVVPTLRQWSFVARIVRESDGPDMQRLLEQLGPPPFDADEIVV